MIYWRSADGKTVHLASCRFARVPWKWAGVMPAEVVHAAAVRMGYKRCTVCRPFAGLIWGADNSLVGGRRSRLVSMP